MTYLLDNFKWIEVNIHYEGVSFNSSRIRQGVDSWKEIQVANLKVIVPNWEISKHNKLEEWVKE